MNHSIFFYLLHFFSNNGDGDSIGEFGSIDKIEGEEVEEIEETLRQNGQKLQRQSGDP